ncbi:hypothetical protein A2U01_0078489, partial [Trifolium medium]|nr:hypothetical protein [Trifolium medium]
MWYLGGGTIINGIIVSDKCGGTRLLLCPLREGGLLQGKFKPSRRK